MTQRLRTCFLDASLAEYEVEVRNLTTRVEIKRDDIIHASVIIALTKAARRAHTRHGHARDTGKVGMRGGSGGRRGIYIVGP